MGWWRVPDELRLVFNSTATATARVCLSLTGALPVGSYYPDLSWNCWPGPKCSLISDELLCTCGAAQFDDPLHGSCRTSRLPHDLGAARYLHVTHRIAVAMQGILGGELEPRVSEDVRVHDQQPSVCDPRSVLVRPA